MTDPGSPLLDFFRIMAILGGILLLAWAALRFWLPRAGGLKGMRSDLMEVIARQPLEPRSTLYVVRAGGEHLLLATSEHGVTLLKTIDLEPQALEKSSFADRLKRVSGKAS